MMRKNFPVISLYTYDNRSVVYTIKHHQRLCTRRKITSKKVAIFNKLITDAFPLIHQEQRMWLWDKVLRELV